MTHSLQLQMPAQVHEERDWRGQMTHLYTFDIRLPCPARFDEPLPAGSATWGSTGYLYIDCEPVRELVPTRQRKDRVLVQPSIMLLIKALRRKFYPGDEEVFAWPVTHVMFTDAAGTGWTKLRPLPALGQPSLPAATNRLKYLYVHIVDTTRAKLSVWLDQMLEEGVLQ